MNDKRTPNTLGWINIKDSLPEVKVDEQGGYNGVLAYLKNNPDDGFRYIVSNTEFVRRHPEQFLYWMYLPQAPVGGKDNNARLNGDNWNPVAVLAELERIDCKEAKRLLGEASHRIVRLERALDKLGKDIAVLDEWIQKYPRKR